MLNSVSILIQVCERASRVSQLPNTVQNIERLLEHWKQMIEGGSSLEKIRGKQMIELTQEGKIDVFVPELMQMVLEMIEVHDLEHFTVCFLDGTKKEILV